jgi:hypothetical protein
VTAQLLRQPGGFEGLLLRLEKLPADDLAFTEGGDGADVYFHLYPAARSTPPPPQRSKNVVAKVAHLAKLDREVVPNLCRLGYALQQTFVPVEGLEARQTSTFSSDIARSIRHARGSSARPSTHSQINGRDSLCR